MKNINQIREKILSIIQKEELHTEKEIQELKHRQRSSMAYYGIGGPYKRYEKAIERRNNHLSELDSIRKAQSTSVVLETLRLYGYFCPSCSEKIYTTGRNPETVDCPICNRTIYKDGMYTEWKVQKDSRYTQLRR